MNEEGVGDQVRTGPVLTFFQGRVDLIFFLLEGMPQGKEEGGTGLPIELSRPMCAGCVTNLSHYQRGLLP